MLAYLRSLLADHLTLCGRFFIVQYTAKVHIGVLPIDPLGLEDKTACLVAHDKPGTRKRRVGDSGA